VGATTSRGCLLGLKQGITSHQVTSQLKLSQNRKKDAQQIDMQARVGRQRDTPVLMNVKNRSGHAHHRACASETTFRRSTHTHHTTHTRIHFVIQTRGNIASHNFLTQKCINKTTLTHNNETLLSNDSKERQAQRACLKICDMLLTASKQLQEALPAPLRPFQEVKYRTFELPPALSSSYGLCGSGERP
jgi:hypothetical protein